MRTNDVWNDDFMYFAIFVCIISNLFRKVHDFLITKVFRSCYYKKPNTPTNG